MRLPHCNSRTVEREGRLDGSVDAVLPVSNLLFFEILAWSQDKYIYTLAVWWNVYFCIVAQSLYHFKNTKLWRFVCTWMWDALARKVHNVNLCTNLENLYIDIILLRSTGLFDMNYTAHKTITGKCCTLPQTCFKYKGLPLNLMCNMTV